MKIGEVCILTNDVVRLADFYKQLFGVDNGSSDAVHQFIFTEEIALTIYKSGEERGEKGNNILLAFTVENVDDEYERLKAYGARIITPPKTQPWGARNMSFEDPDGNLLTFRSFPLRKNSPRRSALNRQYVRTGA